jgi:hypothetical protein
MPRDGILNVSEEVAAKKRESADLKADVAELEAQPSEEVVRKTATLEEAEEVLVAHLLGLLREHIKMWVAYITPRLADKKPLEG